MFRHRSGPSKPVSAMAGADRSFASDHRDRRACRLKSCRPTLFTPPPLAWGADATFNCGQETDGDGEDAVRITTSLVADGTVRAVGGGGGGRGRWCSLCVCVCCARAWWFAGGPPASAATSGCVTAMGGAPVGGRRR
ncbi:RING/U-box superfamily protein [Striga asiatica]|uniref:RING/U-box superfamily protein n=1 Tax=Striga asiatica TaxID=4170 RepID=A0A5A7QZK5_STRAF|nr:RING/U-box superfamily protein [Striga asiatica]